MRTKDAMKVIVDNTKADAKEGVLLVKDWFAQVGRAIKTNPRKKVQQQQVKVPYLLGE